MGFVLPDAMVEQEKRGKPLRHGQPLHSEFIDFFDDLNQGGGVSIIPGMPPSRFFMRALLPLGEEDEFRFGVWIEIDMPTYVGLTQARALVPSMATGPERPYGEYFGRLASDIPFSMMPTGGPLLNLKVRCLDNSTTSRPRVQKEGSHSRIRAAMERGLPKEVLAEMDGSGAQPAARRQRVESV